MFKRCKRNLLKQSHSLLNYIFWDSYGGWPPVTAWIIFSHWHTNVLSLGNCSVFQWQVRLSFGIHFIHRTFVFSYSPLNRGIQIDVRSSEGWALHLSTTATPYYTSCQRRQGWCSNSQPRFLPSSIRRTSGSDDHFRMMSDLFFYGQSSTAVRRLMTDTLFYLMNTFLSRSMLVTFTIQDFNLRVVFLMSLPE